MFYLIPLILSCVIPMTLAGACTFADGSVFCKDLANIDDYLYKMYKLEEKFRENAGATITLEIVNSNLEALNQTMLYPLYSISSDIKSIAITNCSVKEIEGTFFSTFSSLTILDLSNNDGIKDYTFLNLYQLKSLIFDGNSLDPDDQEALFGNLSKTLSSVSLRNCALQTLNVISDNTIARLDLSHNRFNVFNDTYSLGNLDVSELNLSYNDITDVILTQSYSSKKIILKGNLNLKLIQGVNRGSLVYIKELDLSELGTFDWQLLTHTRLSSLILKDTKIATLENSSLQVSYEDLNLSNTQLKETKTYFKDKIIESTLNLSGNFFRLLDSDAFKNSHISTLDLSKCNLDNINESAFNGSIIDKLLLSNNSIEKDVDNICKNINSINQLDLSSNRIASLSSATFANCNSLTYLDLSNNAIQSFTDHTFTHTPSLATLIISVNDINDFSKFKSFAINTLIISNSAISNLTEASFKGLYNLRVLDFAGSTIEDFHARCLSGLFSLRTLDAQTLFGNGKPIPVGFFRDLNALSELNLAFLNLTSIESGTFVGLESLTFLDVSDNIITYVSPDAFSDLLKIETVLLSGNLLTDIPVDLFANATTMGFLDLSFNLLTSLESGVFANMTKLRILDLSHNRLVALPLDVLEPLTDLNSLYLNDNNLHFVSFLDYQFDYVYFKVILPALRHVYLYGNPWDCANLGKMLTYFDENSVVYSTYAYANYSVENVKGIACSHETAKSLFAELVEITQV